MKTELINVMRRFYGKMLYANNIYEHRKLPVCKFILCDSSQVSEFICQNLKRQLIERYGYEPRIMKMPDDFLTNQQEQRLSFVSELLRRFIEEKQYAADLIIARKGLIDLLVTRGWKAARFLNSDIYTATWHPGKPFVSENMQLKNFMVLMPNLIDIKTAVNTALMYHEQKKYYKTDCQVYFDYSFMNYISEWQLACFKLLLLLLKVPLSAFVNDFSGSDRCLGLTGFWCKEAALELFRKERVYNHLIDAEHFDDVMADRSLRFNKLCYFIWKGYSAAVDNNSELKDEKAEEDYVNCLPATADKIHILTRPFYTLAKCLRLAYQYRPEIDRLYKQ